VSGLVVVKAMLIAGVLLAFFLTVLTLRYRITADAVEVLILGKVARRVLLTDIVEVHRRGALLHESWSGLKVWNSVVIRRRSGTFRNFVVSPDDPDRFVRELSLRIAGEGQER
jgi:hypothetical protein